MQYCSASFVHYTCTEHHQCVSGTALDTGTQRRMKDGLLSPGAPSLEEGGKQGNRQIPSNFLHCYILIRKHEQGKAILSE